MPSSRSSRALALLALATLCACEPQAALQPSGPHTLQVPPELALPQGTRVVADYGVYRLIEADDAALATLTTQEGVEQRDDYDQILLNVGPVNTRVEARALLSETASGPRLHLVQFVGPVKREWHAALEASGVRIVSYIPNNAYLVYGEAKAVNALGGRQAVRWTGSYLAEHKLQPSLATAQTDTFTLQLFEDATANGKTLDLIRAKAKAEPLVQPALGYVNVIARLDRSALASLAEQPDVVSIAPRPKFERTDERQDVILAGDLTGSSPRGPGYLAWLGEKGFTQEQFTASGFGVDITDSGMDDGTVSPNHFGLFVAGDVTGQSRVTYTRLEGSPNSGSTLQGCDGHGTINGHIVAGYNDLTGFPHADTAGYRYGLGVAPFVKIGSSVVFDPDTFTDPDYEDLQARAYRDGMRISNNSWGSSSDAYDSDAQRYDALVRDAQPSGSAVSTAGNQEMVIVFAAGNDGPTSSSIGTPATGKNVIAVGASENVHAFGQSDGCDSPDSEANSANDIAPFSSRGPCADGRKKPDIMAPGSHISGGVAQDASQASATPAYPNGRKISCFNADGVCGLGDGTFYWPKNQQWYTVSTGTSHSAPAVAGAAALLRQYFINQGLPPPSPAMTKAYLMGSTRHMTGTGANDTLPSNNQGMGRLDLGLAFDGTARRLEDQTAENLFTATGQTRTFTGSVTDTSKPFLVTLAWTDAPGSTTGSAWKNNLDLSVTVGSTTYKGNVFTGGWSIAGGTADSRNNVEAVFLPSGTTGAFTVTVTATNINSDGVPNNGSALDQDFALVIYNGCSATASTPSGVSATASADNRIDIDWVAGGAEEYRVYRSTTPGGPYERVGTVAAPPFADTNVSGGRRYYYVVRSFACAESPSSAEVSALATGTCSLLPRFAGLATAESAGLESCTNTLTWLAASAECSGTITYSVYRSTTAGFSPSASNRIAQGLTGLTFSDGVGLEDGTTYYYVVRATETAGAIIEETNLVERAATAGGPITPGLRYLDDFDTNRPTNAAAYWTVSGSLTVVNLVAGCHHQSPTTAYRIGAASTSCGGTYPNSTSTNLQLGGNGTVAGINGFAVPTVATAPRLSFSLWYDLERNWDGVYLAYSTAGTSGPWFPVPDSVSAAAPYILAGGYDGTLGSTGTQRTWTGTTELANGSLKQVSVNLDPMRGQTVWFAFRFSSGSIGVAEGFYVDDVRITADQVSSCSSAGPAVGFAFDIAPTVAVGTPAPLVVRAVDAQGRTATTYSGTATLASSDAFASLPGTASFTSGRTAELSVTFGSLGSQSLSATDTVNSALTGSIMVTATPGPAKTLEFLEQPADSSAGAPIAVSVRLRDEFGNVATEDSRTLTLSLGVNPGNSTLSGSTSAAASEGVASFEVAIDKVGAGYTLVASAQSLQSVSSDPFSIAPGPAKKLSFAVGPTNTVAGENVSPAVEVALLDAHDNPTAASARVTLSLATNPGTGSLLGTLAVDAVAGVARFSDFTLEQARTGYSLRATATGMTEAVSGLFAITPAALHHATFATQPSTVAAGERFAPVVRVGLYDRFDNLATQSTSQVELSLVSNPGQSTLSGASRVAAEAGIAIFPELSLNRPGTGYAFEALVVGTGLTVRSQAFDVTPGAATRLAFTQEPSDTAAGAPITPAIEISAYDREGNLATLSTAEVTIAVGTNPAGGTLNGIRTRPLEGGVARFQNLSLDLTGSYTLTAAADGLTGDTSAAFDITPGAAAYLAFAATPAEARAGESFTVEVVIQDVAGNRVSESGVQVTLALESAPTDGALSGTVTRPTEAGLARFTALELNRVGSYTLRASAESFTSVLSEPVAIVPGAAAALVFRTAPATVTAGAPFTVTVELRDAMGNLVDSPETIELELSGPSTVLSGQTSATTEGGVATFDGLSIARAGESYSVVAKATGVPDSQSSLFQVTPGPRAALAFTVQPSTVEAGATIEPAVQVAVQDALGNVVTTAEDIVSLAVHTGPGTLGGTLEVAADQGVARFADLSIALAATGYQLVARATDLPDVESTTFDVTTGAPAKLVFLAQPESAVAGRAIRPVRVALTDSVGNVVVEATRPVTLALGTNLANGQLAGTLTRPLSQGVVELDDLVIEKAGAGYTLVASAEGVSSAETSAFDVAPAPAARFHVELPATALTNVPVTLNATALDAFGNIATSHARSAAVKSSDFQATLPAEARFAAGVVTGLQVTFKQAGLATLTLTDTVDESLNGTAQTMVSVPAPPCVSLSSPSDGAEVSGEVSIVASATVAEGLTVTELAILVDGAILATGTDATLTAPWDTTELAGSTHVLSAQVTDSLGNVASSAEINVTVPSATSGVEKGCGCGTAAGAPTWLPVFGALWLGLRRRRNGTSRSVGH